MAKLGFFLYSKIDIFACTTRKSRHKIKQTEWKAYFEWYLEDSKRGNNRVTSLQETNKNCLI